MINAVKNDEKNCGKTKTRHIFPLAQKRKKCYNISHQLNFGGLKMKWKDYPKQEERNKKKHEEFLLAKMISRLTNDDIYPCDFFYDELSADYWLDEIDFS